MDIPDGFVREDQGATAWACEAYGEAGHEVGAHCFVGGQLGVRCGRKELCALYMANERQRLWRIMNAEENDCDPAMVYLRKQFKSADELLRADNLTSKRHTWIQPRQSPE